MQTAPCHFPAAEKTRRSDRRRPARSQVPAGSSSTAEARGYSPEMRHGRRLQIRPTTSPVSSRKTTSSGMDMKNMWTELQGDSSSPSPSGRCRTPSNPRRREPKALASRTRSAIMRPFSVDAIQIEPFFCEPYGMIDIIRFWHTLPETRSKPCRGLPFPRRSHPCC